MDNIRFSEVQLKDGFWQERYDLNKNVSIKSVYERFEETGRIDALRFNYNKTKPLHIFYDSDVAKWIEAVSYLIIKDRNGFKDYEKIIDELVDSMQKNQRSDGYLNSYFLQLKPDKVFTERDDHELYCAGHLLEAAIAYFEATGKRKFLDIMLKYTDCIEKAFIKEKTAKFSTCGHEEIKIALLKLYRFTKNKKHLDMARHFIYERGQNPDEPGFPLGNAKYTQNNAKAVELRSAEGHAVRAMYYYTAMADYAAEVNDTELLNVCRRLYSDIMTKIYITGGIGSAKLGESFTVPYDIPNLTAYSESCAAIGLMMFCKSMLKNELNAKYADTVEQILYNGFLSSASLDGKAFFYENPLEVRLNEIGKETSILPQHQTSLPSHRRQEVFGCSCCPPNINRVAASIADYIYSVNGETLYIHQYIASAYDGIELTTAFPLDGKILIKNNNQTTRRLAVRKPFWCEKYSVKYNSKQIKPEIINGYMNFELPAGNALEINFIISVKLIAANVKAAANVGRVAVMRGPVVYAVESIDNGDNLNALILDTHNKDFKPVKNNAYQLPDLCVLGYRENETEALYYEYAENMTQTEIKFIPYYTFANRSECDMLVWIRRKRGNASSQ